MSSQEVRMEVADILLDRVSKFDPEELDQKTRLRQDMGMDSAGIWEVAEQVGERFEMAVPETDLDQIETVGDLVTYIESHIR